MSDLITAGGVFMYPLLICSVLIFAISIEILVPSRATGLT